MMSAPFLSLQYLQVTFDIRRPGSWPWTPPRKLHAVNGVSLDLAAGECLGIVGESGSGKSTLARAIIGTVPTSGGKILFEGKDLAEMEPGERRAHRRDVQMIFQDPLAALNPRMTVGEIIAEPLVTHFPKTPRAEVKQRVAKLMERVGLLPNLINRYPHEFSGGQCQRIGIARALILEPKLVICDEPVSALDVSVQAQVINLLMDLQQEFGLSYLFVAHDLAVVEHISHRVAVMYLGRIVEIAPKRAIFTRPQHPYTEALLDAVPLPKPGARQRRRVLAGDVPSPINPPSGCHFHTRCPYAEDRCRMEEPPMQEIHPGQWVACHLRQPAAPAKVTA